MSKFQKNIIILLAIFGSIVSILLFNFLSIYKQETFSNIGSLERVVTSLNANTFNRSNFSTQFIDEDNDTSYTYIERGGNLYLFRLDVFNNTLTVYDISNLNNGPVQILEAQLD